MHNERRIVVGWRELERRLEERRALEVRAVGGFAARRKTGEVRNVVCGERVVPIAIYAAVIRTEAEQAEKAAKLRAYKAKWARENAHVGRTWRAANPEKERQYSKEKYARSLRDSLK